MLFTSSTFLIFFLFTFIIYYLPCFRSKQVFILVVASFIFYAWSSPGLLILLLLSVLVNSTTSYKIATVSRKNRIIWAIAGVVINLAILALFKYGALLTNLVLGSASVFNPDQPDLVHLLLHLPLPLGISFYTFEGISLLIDVLKQKQSETEKTHSSPERSYLNVNLSQHFFNTSLFITFFPHLIAEPILKARNFYPQISQKQFKEIPWENAFRSLTTGYFLKMVVADNLKDYTFWISAPYYQTLGSGTNLVLLFGYSMQIFADFAGYSLIAIGLAATLGYTLPQNFEFPYISRSIAEFWRRWHISLSTWLRDYLYFPLGGNRKGQLRTYANLLIVMTLGGLWHGASWSYAVWGIFHGVLLALERFLGWNEKSKTIQQNPQPFWQQFLVDSIRIVIVFSLVSLGWLLFKLPNFNEAIHFLITLKQNIPMNQNWNFILPVLIFSVPVLVYHLFHFPTFQNFTLISLTKRKGKRSEFYKILISGLMLACILLNGGSANEFIYFQF